MQNQIIIMQTLLISVSIIGLLVLSVAYLLYQNFNQGLILQANFSSQVAKAKFDIEENTLRAISQKLHDNIQPDLVYTKTCLKNLHSIPFEEMIEKINYLYQKIATVINDITKLSKNINSTFVIQNGLWYSVEQLTKDLNIIGKISAKLNLKGSYKKISSDMELILFRIVQEAITNCLKYSKADEIIITLDFTPSKLILTIEDNGIGFSTNETLSNCYKKYSSGLKSMMDKANAIKAKLNLYSTPGQGTIVLITTPYQN